jgi:hypothetical protein
MLVKSNYMFLFIMLISFAGLAKKDSFLKDPSISNEEKSQIIEGNLKKSKWIKRYYIKEIETSAFESNKIMLNLFSDVGKNVSIQKREHRGKRTILFGKTEESQFNNVKILINNDTKYVSGTAFFNGNSFRFWTLPNGKCVVAEMTIPEGLIITDKNIEG